MRTQRIISLYNMLTLAVGLSLGFGLGWALHTETIVVRPNVADTPAALSSVNLMIDDGEHIRTWNTVDWHETLTPLGLLEKVAAVGAITIETEPSTKGGNDVHAIDGIANTKKRWQYWVNNTQQPRAADKYSLKPGDIVVWKYVIPTE